MKKILTVFSGRKRSLQILKKYLEKAIEENIIDEVHLWNYARLKSDEEYIKEISNIKRSSGANNDTYNKIHTPIINNSFIISAKTKYIVQIKLEDTTTNNRSLEIILGNWENTFNIIVTKNGKELYVNEQPPVLNEFNYIPFTFSIVEIEPHTLYLVVKRENTIIIQTPINEPHFSISTISVKTGNDSVGMFKYETTQNKGFYLMDTCVKCPWTDYYMHYSNSAYTDDIIIKCDDDIVFIDLPKMNDFIHYTAQTDEYDCVFANTINNGVSAFFQQNLFHLVPKEIMDLEYPENGLKGSLWENGQKASVLHHYFIENKNTFLNYNYNKQVIPILTRYSINFFAFKGKNWYKIQDCGINDEEILTVDYVKKGILKNALYCDFIVSHLSFFRQEETGIDSENLLEMYKNIVL